MFTRRRRQSSVFFKLRYMLKGMVRYTYFLVSIKNTFGIMTFVKYDKGSNMSFEYFMATEEVFIIANIIQNTLNSTQHEDNNTNLLKMTSNV